MRVSYFTWITRVLWILLPMTVGEGIASAMTDRSEQATLVWTVALWFLWTSGLLAALVLTPRTLTFLRILSPLPVMAGIVSALIVRPGSLGWIGLAFGAALVVVINNAEVGNDFVNGPSYGDERRILLRPPAAVWLGPVELVWLATVAPLAAGIALLAAEQWLAGAVLVAAGAGSSWWSFRTFHRLARRWLVLVPAGVTLVDHLVLAEPTLFRRDLILRLGPAPIDSDAADLTAGASGLILSIDMVEPVPVVPAGARGRATEAVAITAMLIAPSRPGLLLTLAEGRKIVVSRS